MVEWLRLGPEIKGFGVWFLQCWSWVKSLGQALNPHCLSPPSSNGYQVEWKSVMHECLQQQKMWWWDSWKCEFQYLEGSWCKVCWTYEDVWTKNTYLLDVKRYYDEDLIIMSEFEVTRHYCIYMFTISLQSVTYCLVQTNKQVKCSVIYICT